MALPELIAVTELTTAIVFGTLITIGVLLFMNRDHTIFINLRLEEDPLLFGASAVATIYGYLTASQTALTAGGVLLLLALIAYFVNPLSRLQRDDSTDDKPWEG